MPNHLFVTIQSEPVQATARNAHRLLAAALRQREEEPVYRPTPPEQPSMSVPRGIVRALIRSFVRGTQGRAAAPPVVAGAGRVVPPLP